MLFTRKLAHVNGNFEIPKDTCLIIMMPFWTMYDIRMYVLWKAAVNVTSSSMTSTGSSFFDPCKSIAAVTEVVITTTQKIILKKWKGKKKMRPVMHTKADSSQHISSMYERTTHSSARYWVSYMLPCIDQTWCIERYSYTNIYVSQCSNKSQISFTFWNCTRLNVF